MIDLNSQRNAVKTLDRIFELYKRNSSCRIVAAIKGQTGTGKTTICRELSLKHNIKFKQIDLTQISATGFQGQTLLDCLLNGEDVSKKQVIRPRMVVILDEADKLRHKRIIDDSIKTIHIQEELLSILNGERIKTNDYEVDFSETLPVLLGVFSGIKFEHNHLVKHFCPEFIDRIQVRIELNPLSRSDLRAICNYEVEKLATTFAISDRNQARILYKLYQQLDLKSGSGREVKRSLYNLLLSDHFYNCAFSTGKRTGRA